MRKIGEIRLAEVKAYLADGYPPPPPFVESEPEAKTPIKIVVYTYGPRGGDAAVSHAWFIEAQAYVRAFFGAQAVSGLIYPDKFRETINELILNGHSINLETRHLRTTGFGQPSPIEIEEEWTAAQAEKAQ